MKFLGIIALILALATPTVVSAEQISLTSQVASVVVSQAVRQTQSSSVVKDAGGILDNLDAHVSYCQSLKNSDKSGLALVASYELIDITLPAFLGSKKIGFNADLVGFTDGGIDSINGGFGGSISIKKVISALNVGIGYLPQGYGWSVYVGIAKIM